MSVAKDVETNVTTSAAKVLLSIAAILLALYVAYYFTNKAILNKTGGAIGLLGTLELAAGGVVAYKLYQVFGSGGTTAIAADGTAAAVTTGTAAAGDAEALAKITSTLEEYGLSADTAASIAPAVAAAGEAEGTVITILEGAGLDATVAEAAAPILIAL